MAKAYFKIKRDPFYEEETSNDPYYIKMTHFFRNKETPHILNKMFVAVPFYIDDLEFALILANRWITNINNKNDWYVIEEEQKKDDSIII